MGYPERKTSSQAPLKTGEDAKYYFTTGNPFYPSYAPPPGTLDRAGNCTWYAWGRYWEMSKRESSGNRIRPSWLPTMGAGRWFENVAEQYRSSSPRVGAIAVWKNTNDYYGGHVAIVEEVFSDGRLLLSNSAYQSSGPGKYFYIVNDATPPQYRGSGLGSTYVFQGFIINPNLDSGDVPDPSKTPARITSVTQLSATQVQIKGELGGIEGITIDNKIYYKWDSSDVSSSSYSGVVNAGSGSVSGRSYTLTITKPRETSSIAVRPYQVNTGYSSYAGSVFTKQLIPSIPCINVKTGSAMAQAIPYIFTNGKWKKGVPCLFTGGKWRQIYNDKK